MSDNQDESFEELNKSGRYSPETQKAIDFFAEHGYVIMSKDISFKSSLKRKINRLKNRLKN